MELSPTAKTNLQAWLDNDQLKEFHEEIQTLLAKEDWQALNDAFFTQVEFGTAGIRGKTGLGSARINDWTVGTAAQGLADYIASQGEAAKARGIVIGSDTRLTSPRFVKLVADILTSNGITVYKFVRPPQVGMFSYAVRLKKALAGVYISASHNPPTDNGLKIYWEDGAQVLPPHDKAITAAVKAVTVVKKETPDTTLLHEIGEDFDSVYRSRVLQESVYRGRSAHVVYSPFHGTGQWGVLPILQEAGFSVTTVDEQMAPDGHFPHVPGGVPNPQNKESNGLTAAKVLETGADLGISTDPDADRLGLVVPKGDQTVIIDGNQAAALLAYFVASRLKAADQLPQQGFMTRTIVTTPLIDAIAADFGLKCYNALPVGFKFIGQCIKEHEDFGDELFIFGGEESYGCLKGSYARDKDASVAALLAAEMVSWLKDEGRTVWDLFDEMEARYGVYLSDPADIYYEGAEGFTKMARLMEQLRTNPPQTVGEWTVTRVIDRQDPATNEAAGTIPTNMVILELSADGKNTVIIRPSGTEPKVKLYISTFEKDPSQKMPLVEKTTALKAALKELAVSLAG